MRGADAADQLRHRLLQLAARGVIGLHGEVRPPLQQQIVGHVRLARRVYGDGVAAFLFGHLHAGHVGQPVAHVDHVGKGHAALVFGGVGVEVAVVGDVEDALVDAEEVLRLGGVVDRRGRPFGAPVFVVAERGGEHRLEAVADARAEDDLLQPGGDDVVFHLHAALPPDRAHAVEPRLHPGEKLHLLAQFGERLAGEFHRASGEFFHHVHVGEYAVHVRAQGKLAAQAPEGVRLHAQPGDEAVFLHVPGRERLVKVVDKGHDGRLHLYLPPIRSRG